MIQLLIIVILVLFLVIYSNYKKILGMGYLIILIPLFLISFVQPVPAGDYRPYQDKFLHWIIAHSDPQTGLPYSHVGDERFEKWCITYDAAVTALAYLATGEVERAKKIIDFYRTNENVWRLGGVIGAVYAPDASGAGESWLVWSGENLWLGIASFHLFQATKQKEYLNFTQKIADFIINLQNENKKDLNYGGIPLGPKGDPDIMSDQLINYEIEQPSFSEIYATEHNIDAYALLNLLYQKTKNKKYQEAKDKILIWFKKVAYNPKEHRFNRGARREIDTAMATDVHSWGISALGVDGLDNIEPGLAEKIIEFVEKNCLGKATFTKPNGDKVTVEGVDYVDYKTAENLGRESMVSPEWTFQLVNAYKKLADDFETRGEQKKADSYRQKRLKLIENILTLAIEDSGGLAFPYATLAKAPTGHGIDTPDEGNLSMIGATWAILGLSGFDPLVVK